MLQSSYGGRRIFHDGTRLVPVVAPVPESFPVFRSPDPPPPRRFRGVATGLHPIVTRAKRRATFSGVYRVFNDAEYRAYRDDSGPPDEGDIPIGASSNLPFTPEVTYGDAIWRNSLAFFNGIFTSGFLPLGERGETWLELEIVAGAEKARPPAGPVLEALQGPGAWRAYDIKGGIVRILGTYRQAAGPQATHWVLTYTTDGTDPVAAPGTGGTQTRVTQALGGGFWHPLEYELPAQDDETVVKITLQMGRQVGETWYYSENSETYTVTVSTAGPAAPG